MVVIQILNIGQKLILKIPFHIRHKVAEILHPDARSIKYTWISQPYSDIEVKVLNLDEPTLTIHNDIIHKEVDRIKKNQVKSSNL
jgi:hypothetical protein